MEPDEQPVDLTEERVRALQEDRVLPELPDNLTILKAVEIVSAKLQLRPRLVFLFVTEQSQELTRPMRVVIGAHAGVLGADEGIMISLGELCNSKSANAQEFAHIAKKLGTTTTELHNLLWRAAMAKHTP